MIFMLEATYPGTRADEAAKRFLERLKNNPMPDSVKIRDLYGLAGGDGFRVFLFYDVDDTRAKEGLDWIAGGMVDTLRNIEGYKMTGIVVYPMEEAFAFLGMQAPSA
jgi:hypothetical protein